MNVKGEPFGRNINNRETSKYFHKVNDLFEDVKTGGKAWWSIVKRLYGEKMQSTVSTFIEGVRQIGSDAQEKAEMLNEYFAIRVSSMICLHRSVVILLFRMM